MSDPVLSLRPATPDDARRVWEWRNEEGTRRASFQSAVIPYEAHEAWFPRLLAKTDSRMFIADVDGVPAGVVRVDNLAAEPEISIALAPAARGRGYGSRAIDDACARVFRETAAPAIVALVRRDNPASASAFLRAGFTHDRDLDVAGIPSSRLVLVRPS